MESELHVLLRLTELHLQAQRLIPLEGMGLCCLLGASPRPCWMLVKGDPAVSISIISDPVTDHCPETYDYVHGHVQPL